MGMLIGNLTTGYRYLTDPEEIKKYNLMKEAAAEMMVREAASRKAQKERSNMKAMDIYALAQVPGGVATLKSGNVEIPVRIKEINHESGIGYQSTTEIVCERVEIWSGKKSTKLSGSIKNVYFNDPVTVVIWTDGTKTIVKAQGDEPYDPEKGLAMAIAKKFLGKNDAKSDYYDVFKKWLPKKKEDVTVYVKVPLTKDDVIEASDKDVYETLFPDWKIWVTYLDTETGEIIGRSVHPVNYTRKASAERRAKQLWGDNPSATWIVSKTNPWEEK